MKHYMKLNPEPFEKIIAGQKTIELRLYDDKRKLINPEDQIVFKNIDNPFRTVQVTVSSLLNASSFEALFRYVTLSECGFSESGVTNISATSAMEKYYTLEKQKEYGVVGIKFSVDKNRSLSEIVITEDEINAFFTKNTDINESEIKEVQEWLAWHKENYTLQGLENLDECIDLFDSSVELFIDMLTNNLMEKAEEAGYCNIEDFLDRPFRAEEFFYMPNWWKTTRNELIRFYCGITI